MSLVVYSQDRDLVVGRKEDPAGQIVVYNHAYFEYLQDEDGYGYEERERSRRNSRIPDDIFVQGYYNRFFRQVEVLGNGSRAVVYKVKHMLLENELGTFAVKKICIGDDIHWLYRCLKEVKLLNRLTENSSHLITYNHVWLEKCRIESLILKQNAEPTSSEAASIDMDLPTTMPYMFILQQFCCGGNLDDVIQYEVFNKVSGKESRAERKRKLLDKQRKGLTTEQIVSIARDIGTGLKQLHSLRIIHRDLKPSNCLLLEEYNREDPNSFPKCVIGDFGESQLYGQLRDATGSTGTLEFVAPELTQGAQFSFKSDIYAFGMILYFAICGQLPFLSRDMSIIKDEIFGLSLDPQNIIATHEKLDLTPIDPRLFDLVCEMLNHDPSLRPDLSRILYQLDVIAQKNKTKTIPTNTPYYMSFPALYTTQIALTLTVLNQSKWIWWKYTILFITGLSYHYGQLEAGNDTLCYIIILCAIISIVSTIV